MNDTNIKQHYIPVLAAVWFAQLNLDLTPSSLDYNILIVILIRYKPRIAV